MHQQKKMKVIILMSVFSQRVVKVLFFVFLFGSIHLISVELTRSQQFVKRITHHHHHVRFSQGSIPQLIFTSAFVLNTLLLFWSLSCQFTRQYSSPLICNVVDNLEA